jgi:hypothetical protein
MRLCRKRGRAVEGTSLENWRGFAPFVSSNLTASASKANKPLIFKGFLIYFGSPYNPAYKIVCDQYAEIVMESTAKTSVR